MRKLLLALAAVAGLSAVSACTHMNNCTGNGFENPEYCKETLKPNAGPYAYHNDAAM
jgi:hypothetical protein